MNLTTLQQMLNKWKQNWLNQIFISQIISQNKLKKL